MADRIHEVSKNIVERLLEEYRFQYTSSGHDMMLMEKLCKAIALDAMTHEDEQFREFCERKHSWFKPSPEQQQRAAQLKALEDPEIVDAIHDMEHRVHGE